jgi:hypothetical protein
MTVSQHASKASIPGGAQFDSFSLSQGHSPQQELHEWGQNSLHNYRRMVAGASRNWLPLVDKAHFVARTDNAYFCAACCAKRQRFSDLTCLESQNGPRVRLHKIISTQPVASGHCAEHVEAFFLYYHELLVVPYPLSDAPKFR